MIRTNDRKVLGLRKTQPGLTGWFNHSYYFENRTADRESDRYLFMMRNIPRPFGAEVLFATENVELFVLDGPPAEWEIGDDGGWNGYGPAR